MAENENEIVPNDVAVPTEVAEPVETAEAPVSLTPDQVNEIVAKRLREANEKHRLEMDRYQRELTARDAYIQGLAHREAPKEEDPFAGLSDDEKMLARANRAAVAPIEKKFEQFQQQMQAIVGSLTLKEQAEDFFTNKGSHIPTFVKSRSMQILKQGAQHGITLEGAYKLAMADYAEMSLTGQLPSPETTTKQPVTKKSVNVPHTELGGANRSLVNRNAPKEMSWAEFRAEAEKNLKYAPMEGARAGEYGTRGYNGEEIG